jgi:hypothetical protein
MRKLVVLVLFCLPLVLAGSVPASAGSQDPSPSPQGRTTSARDVPAFQSARNRQYKAMKFRYVRLCPSCTAPRYTSNNFTKATGTVKVEATTYKILDQNHKYDFFLVDATATLTKRKGDEDWGWMDVELTSKGKAKVLSSSYTLGKGNENRTSCKAYPVDLGVAFFGVSAGTTAGHVTLCHPGSKVASSSISRGRLYHATGLGGLASIQMQRYVRVKQGALPKFAVTADRNTEYSTCASGADGYFCYVIRQMGRSSLVIGSSPQKP